MLALIVCVSLGFAACALVLAYEAYAIAGLAVTKQEELMTEVEQLRRLIDCNDLRVSKLHQAIRLLAACIKY